MSRRAAPDMLRVLGPKAVVYLDLTGSGNETAAHLRATGRLTLMLCAFEGAPMILRLYGAGRVLRRGGPDYARLLATEYGGAEPLGARQMIRLDIDLVQTSCGFGVPLFDHAGERPTLARWAEAKEIAGGAGGLSPAEEHPQHRRAADRPVRGGSGSGRVTPGQP